MDTFSISPPGSRSEDGFPRSDADLLAAALGLPAGCAAAEVAHYLSQHRGSLREGVASLLNSVKSIAGVGGSDVASLAVHFYWQHGSHKSSYLSERHSQPPTAATTIYSTITN